MNLRTGVDPNGENSADDDLVGIRSTTLKGRFIYDGDPPSPQDRFPQLSKLEADSEFAKDSNGRVSGVASTYQSFLRKTIRPKTLDASLVVGKECGVANVVIWIESKDVPWLRPAEQRPANIKLEAGNYSPRITVVTIGQPLHVENLDPIEFNFHTSFTKNPSANVLLPACAFVAIAPQSLRVREVRKGADAVPFGSRALGHRLPVHSPQSLCRGQSRRRKFSHLQRTSGRMELPRLARTPRSARTLAPRGLPIQGRTGDNDLGTIKIKPDLLTEKPPARKRS